MPDNSEALLKRPLYVFDLPTELLPTLQLKKTNLTEEPVWIEASVKSSVKSSKALEDNRSIPKSVTSCLLCSASFSGVYEQRQHIKSDRHSYNLKQKLAGRNAVTENEFEKLVEDLDESISGLESLELDSNDELKESSLVTLLKKQARITYTGTSAPENAPPKKRGSGNPPLIWLSSSVLPPNTFLGVYKALFTDSELEGEPDITAILRQKQLSPIPSKSISSNPSNGVLIPSMPTGPQVFLCMIGGGHFAAMIVSLTPKLTKKPGGEEERQAIVIAHKTFHRYTTRRKQGGSQSANDSFKGAAHSAGASIRRHNEAALEIEIRALLAEWSKLIEKSQLVFVRASGNSNRRTLFGPYDGQVLRYNDPRNRSFQFSTRRATQAELMRAFVELTRMKVSHMDEAALLAADAAELERHVQTTKTHPTPSQPEPYRHSKEDEEGSLHTSQLQALIRRFKVPATLSYLSTNSLSADFKFSPPTTKANHHAPTPLHLAASINSPLAVLALLVKGGANPSSLNGEGNPPFDLAGDRSTRDAFRIARSEIGEGRWDWTSAHCPPPLSKADADKREEHERAEAEREEAERREVETERLKIDNLRDDGKRKGNEKPGGGMGLGLCEKRGAERREVESRGLTPEMKLRLERERRARAAEERMRKISGSLGGGGNYG